MAKLEVLNKKSFRKRDTLEQLAVEKDESVVDHQSEKELRQLVDEERYRAAFESAGDIMILIDKKGKIIDINGKSVEISGYEKEEVVGKHIRVLSKILTKKSLRIMVFNFLKRMAGFDILPYEIELIKKDGQLLIFEVSAQPLRKDGKIIGDLGILRDVTARKRAENEIRQRSSDINLINIINEAANQGKAFEQVLQLVSRGTQKLFGGNVQIVYLLSQDKRHLVMENLNLPPQMAHGIEKLIGGKIPDINIKLRPGGTYAEILKKGKPVLINDYNLMLNVALECFEDKTFLKIVPPAINILGVNSVIIVPLKSDSEIIGLLGIGRHEPFTESDMKRYETIAGQLVSVIKRKQAEKQLAESEDNLKTYLENAPDGVYLCDVSGNFLYGNKKAEGIMGYKKEELIGKNFFELNLLSGEYLEKAGELIKLNALGKNTGPDEFELVRKDKSHVWVEINTAPIKQKDNNVVIGFVRNISERKQVEQLYHTLVDSAPVGVYIVQDDRYVFANLTLQEKTGYTEKELLSIAPVNIIYPEDRQNVRKNTSQMLQGERIAPYEYRIITKSGEINWTLEKVALITHQGKQAIMGIMIDTTESKLARQMYQTLADSSPVGVYVVQDRKFVFTNPVFQKISGYSADELSEIEPAQLVHLEDREMVRECSVKMLKGQLLQPYEFRLVTKKGTFVWGLERMTSITYEGKMAAVGNFMDITERKQAEERLAQAAQEWRTTFDSITDLISIHDKDNRLLRVNKAVADLLKTTPKELLGRYCHEAMHGTKEPPVNCPHLQTMITGKPAVAEIYSPNLEIFFHESTSPLFNEKGEVIGTVMVARDVTKQKRMEEQLIVTDRLASIGELSSGIAHELNNPLTSVIGFSQLLMEGNVPDDMKENLATIYSEAQRAAVIVKNLLTFARKHAPVKQLTQINLVIEGVLRLRSYEEKVNNIEVEKNLANNLPEIMIDSFQMQQVFLNIIVNAEFAMLEAHNRGKLIITTEKLEGIIKIAFTDDGPGITKENMKRIFDPFFTTKEVGKGTGLGLSICHGIVIEHGGQIYVKSEYGQGATFIVELPLYAQ
jgi:PAS domain S-box-containing protein